MPLAAGDPFDRYVIEAVLGEGGMGRVYRALDTRLERRVALKILRAPTETRDGAGISSGDVSDGPSRLLREARAAAALDHPNAVSVFDVGEVDGIPYIAMELIEGRSLRGWMGDPSVPVERRIRWLIEIAQALAAAHARGLVHRDVKPENVMVRSDDVVKVLDFGIARRLRLDVDVAAAAGDGAYETLTAAGVLLGTPLYMSPEQLRSESVDGRADQFAWGVVAYELLSGAPPWGTRSSGIQLVSDILSKDPAPMGQAAADIPSAVEATIRKALGKAPRDRFASMDEIALALEPFGARSLRDVEIDSTMPPPSRSMTRPVRGPRASRLRVAIGAVIAFAAAAAIVAGFTRHHDPTVSGGSPEPSASAAPLPSPTAVTELPPPKTSNPEAAAAYLAGLQGIRDASVLAAITSFRRAIALDSSLAAAHVRLASFFAAQGDAASARDHLQSARQLRASLSERDLAVLDAVEPSVMRQPPDTAESERRMSAAADRWSGDAELAFYLARYRQVLGRREAAVAALDRAAAADPRFALVWWARGIDAEDGGDFDRALAAYGRCLEISPSAASCLRSRSTIYAQRGDCAQVEADARRMIVMEPGGWRGYEFLARALYARGKPTETTREALQQKWALFSEERRRAREAFDRAQLDLLRGDFTSAEARANELQRLVASSQSELDHTEPARLLVEIYGEEGDSKRAGIVADDFRNRREVWIATRALGDSSLHGAVPAILAASRRAGLLSPEAFEIKRAEWLNDAKASLSPLWHKDLWGPAYAEPAETADEARAALVELARFATLPPPPRDLTLADAASGKVLFLAGRIDESVPYLRRAVATCLAFDEPVAHTRAAAYLGRALEALGDKEGACAAYAVVLSRWGNAKPRSTTASAARARSQALRCRPGG